MSRSHNGFAVDALRLDAEMLAKFYTRAGWLTPYALACGYIERVEIDAFTSVQLWAEHGVYHVRAVYGPGRTWETFPTLGEARRAFCALVRIRSLPARCAEVAAWVAS